MILEGNSEMFQSYSDYVMKADDFYSQNSVSDIIAADLKMLLLLLIYHIFNLDYYNSQGS